MIRRLGLALCAPLLLGALSGCDALWSLTPVLANLPLVGALFPQPAESPLPIPHARRQPVAGTASASVTGQATPAPDEIARWAERNRQFDRLRTMGLMQLYAGQSAAALDNFKKAQALRPNDPQIAELIDLTLHPAAHVKAQGFSAMPLASGSMPHAPAAPNTPNAASLFNFGATSSLPAAMARPAAGDKPAGLFQ